MRINTDRKDKFQKDLYDRVDELMNESTRSGAVDASAQFTEEMMQNLERAMDYPNMTLELAVFLSSSQVELPYEI